MKHINSAIFTSSTVPIPTHSSVTLTPPTLPFQKMHSRFASILDPLANGIGGTRLHGNVWRKRSG
ncbi:hypothetical protein E2C01_007420 [Portunus trituberculatus]|uniref:Uncharacterized protein n=1 Tax=Portunus trituberculatus TaxID=210409 RepID=A0A5B7CYZ7_PORTR|nr:hypothetical protein [Portunus trituberculatus]